MLLTANTTIYLPSLVKSLGNNKIASEGSFSSPLAHGFFGRPLIDVDVR